MIIEQSQHIIDEISKVFIGKDEIIKKELTETITKKTGIQNVTFGTCSYIGKDNAEYYVNFKSDDGKNVYSVIKRNKDITVSVN